MYKAIKDNKIIAISETDNKFPCLVQDEIIEDTEHTVEEYEQYNGEYLLKDEIPKPSHDEQSEKRRLAYIAESDPISAHISYLQRKEQTPEIVAEIAQLEAEQEEIRNAIKERFPYYE